MLQPAFEFLVRLQEGLGVRDSGVVGKVEQTDAEQVDLFGVFATQGEASPKGFPCGGVTYVQPFDGASDDRGTEAKEKNEALSHYGKYSRYNGWLNDAKEDCGMQGFRMNVD